MIGSNINFENLTLKSSLIPGILCACAGIGLGVFCYKYTKTILSDDPVEVDVETERIPILGIDQDETNTVKENDIKLQKVDNPVNNTSSSLSRDVLPKKDRENLRIREVNNSPLELRKRFNNKGFIFAHQNLATVNVELNEFIELMRRYDLNILDGCTDPNRCNCTFRHKRCRLFMIRKYSGVDEIQYYSPHCSGVTTISPSNVDILMGTPIYEFVQMFQNKFLDRIIDLISYVNYVVGSDCNEESDYVVDVTMIADPYYNYNHENESENTDTKNKCTSFWHQDHFVETKTKQYHSYDIIALFILNAKNTTPHKLMIGKLKSDVDVSGMTLGQIQEHIVMASEFAIDDEICSDIGYVIDQRRNFFHKHSDFSHQDIDSRRNIITIRIKYLK
jgi:hypothetical protein